MLKIRLRRMGAIRQPHYRVVVADARSPRDGRFIENLGHYNPLTDPATIQIDIARYEEWKKKGAQPTDAVVSLVKQFNRTQRKAAEAGEAAPPARQSVKTRTASGKRSEPKAEAAAPEATGEMEAAGDAPMNEAMAEASRDDGEGSEALTGGMGDGAAESDAVIDEAAETGGSANPGAATEESDESAG
jgi:small subunit ribosomal protein S16